MDTIWVKMKFETKFKILMFKKYFDQGMSTLHYVRWLILFFGVSSLNPKVTVGLGLGYVAVCWITGYCWFKYKWILAENEVGARWSLITRELREHMHGKAFKKKGKRWNTIMTRNLEKFK